MTDNLEKYLRGEARPQAARRLTIYLTAVRKGFVDYEELAVVSRELRVIATSAKKPSPIHLPENWLALAKSDAPIKTLKSDQPKPKAKFEQGTENIPVLNEVVDRPVQPKKPKKPPVPLATPKVTPADVSRKKQSKHKAPEPSPATAKTEARNVAVNVIAKLNMELRKCGERALSPVTIDRLQFLLREALEQHSKDVENNRKRR